MKKFFATKNQKGGGENTPPAINLAASLARLDQRVLLVDVDPQANATSGVGILRNVSRHTTYGVLVLKERMENAILPTEFSFELVPSDRNLAGAEVEMVDLPDRELLLRNSLAPIRDRYACITLAFPPARNHLTLNGL